MPTRPWYYHPAWTAVLLGLGGGAATHDTWVVFFVGFGSYLALRCIGIYIREAVVNVSRYPQLSKRQLKWFVFLGILPEPRHSKKAQSRSTSSKE